MIATRNKSTCFYDFDDSDRANGPLYLRTDTAYADLKASMGEDYDSEYMTWDKAGTSLLLFVVRY